MTLFSFLGILLIGILAGVLSSMVGIGGGIVIVPALVLFYGLSQHSAQGTVLAMLSIPVSLVAAITYHKQGMVNWKIALILAVGFVIGGYYSSKLAVQLPTATIKKVFAVVMIIIAIKFLFFEKKV